MEEETDEVIKRYDSPLSFWHILCVVLVVAVVAFGHWCLPTIVDFVQVGIDWINWFCLVLSYLSLCFVVVSVLIFLIYVSFWSTTGKSKPKSYDQYPLESPVVRALSCDYIGLSSEYGDYGNNYTRYMEISPPFQATKPAVESHYTYDRVVAEVNSKSYKRTRLEKERTKVEYRRMESERVTTSQTMIGLSSEEIRMTVETFITEKKLLRENGVDDHWHNGVFDQWQNGVVDQWQTGLPQLQNGDVRWQESRDDGTGRRRRHRSRNHRLVAGSGSGSTGSGSYLAISN